MTNEERARQIDAEEFRRESEQALARALAYSNQKRMEEKARITGTTAPVQEAGKPSKFTLGRKPELYAHNGMTRSISEWATHLNVSYGAFRRRVHLHGIAKAIEMGGRSKRGHRAKTPGVDQNLSASKGTGGGSTAQETAKITFSNKAMTE